MNLRCIKTAMACLVIVFPVMSFANAQGVLEQLPWSETFTAPNGQISDEGATSWIAVRENGFFELQDNALVINGSGSEAVARFGVVDISNGAVSVSLDLKSRGNLEDNQDYVRLFKKVDGGGEELIGEKRGQQAATEISSSAIVGNTLELVVRTYVSYEDEFYYLNNLKVSSTSEIPILEVTEADTSQICQALGVSLTSAIAAYESSCLNLSRVDCDPVGNGDWICSSEAISASAPVKPIAAPDSTIPTTPAPSPTPAPTLTPTTPDTPTTVNPTDMGVDHTYAKNDGPFKNPLKGWNSGWDGGNDHPESSVGFQYIPWKDFEPVDGRFDFQAVERIIDRQGSRNRHLILRLYCDWHGSDFESDCPSWMYTTAGVSRLQGDNGRYITDFNDTNYIAQAQDAIQALADKYDDDPRMYAVQMGVIGYWGEWHAWGSSFNGGGYNITSETKSAILNAYTSNFDSTKIMARYPWRAPEQSATGIGFHNDYFVADNGHSEEFDDAIFNGSQWMSNPIGGEVPPRGNGEANNEKSILFNGNTGLDIIEKGRYSTMKAGAYRVTQGQSGYDGYMRLHKKMGYNYQIDVARFDNAANRTTPFALEVIGTNIGVAPMYFDWDIQFALLDQSGSPLVTQDVAYDITSIMPEAMFYFTEEIDLNTINQGVYRLAIRIIQPDADTPSAAGWKLAARNTYILFANDLSVVRGNWSDDGLTGGWSVLGEVLVQ